MTIPIPIYNRKNVLLATAIVDDVDDWVLAHTWRLTHAKEGRGYAYRSVYVDGKKKMSLMHREVLQLALSRSIDGLDGEHINGCVVDNRRENLRVATRSENMQNMIGRRRSRLSSQHRGVSFDPRMKLWRAFAGQNRRVVHIGLFLTEQEAADAAVAWRKANMPFSEMDRLAPEPPPTAPFVRQRRAKPRAGKSQYRGVFPSGTEGRWRAKFRGKPLGTFASEEEAARAWDRVALEEWGPGIHQNLPPSA